MTKTTDPLIEAMARAVCLEGGFDPNEIMPNDGPRWRYYVPGATAALSVVKQHLTSPESVERARVVFSGGLVNEPDKLNPRGYTTYYKPEKAMKAALLAALEGNEHE